MRRLSLTTWSLHRLLGAPEIGRGPGSPTTAAEMTLEQVPARMRQAGIETLEICHFHLTGIDDAALARMRAACDAAGIEVFSVLIDAGDVSATDARRADDDEAMIAGWIDVAARLGASHVRVIAGDAPADDHAARQRSVAALQRLAAYAAPQGIRVLTENFRTLAATAESCRAIIAAASGTVGLCADIGNFPLASRVSEFAAVAPLAESIHVKAHYSADGTIVGSELEQCLAASVAAGFAGPYTLVYDRPGDTWSGIDTLRGIVAHHCVG
ncbi:MAG: sugar phosphate isomerase/epimerase [Chloroflexi bacterium]|nr:sugar phosphate isomerase/epimerase [Chloroflexota bacterium]